MSAKTAFSYAVGKGVWPGGSSPEEAAAAASPAVNSG